MIKVGDKVVITDKSSSWWQERGTVERIETREIYQVYVRFEDDDWCNFKYNEMKVIE